MQIVLNTTLEHRPSNDAELVLYPPGVLIELDDALAQDAIDRGIGSLPEGAVAADVAAAGKKK